MKWDLWENINHWKEWPCKRDCMNLKVDDLLTLRYIKQTVASSHRNVNLTSDLTTWPFNAIFLFFSPGFQLLILCDAPDYSWYFHPELNFLPVEVLMQSFWEEQPQVQHERHEMVSFWPSQVLQLFFLGLFAPSISKVELSCLPLCLKQFCRNKSAFHSIKILMPKTAFNLF